MCMNLSVVLVIKERGGKDHLDGATISKGSEADTGLTYAGSREGSGVAGAEGSGGGGEARQDRRELLGT